MIVNRPNRKKDLVWSRKTRADTRSEGKTDRCLNKEKEGNRTRQPRGKKGEVKKCASTREKDKDAYCNPNEKATPPSSR